MICGGNKLKGDVGTYTAFLTVMLSTVPLSDRRGTLTDPIPRSRASHSFDEAVGGSEVREELRVIDDHSIGPSIEDVRDAASVGNEAIWGVT
jgi:hypothetical protein